MLASASQVRDGNPRSEKWHCSYQCSSGVDEPVVRRPMHQIGGQATTGADKAIAQLPGHRSVVYRPSGNALLSCTWRRGVQFRANRKDLNDANGGRTRPRMQTCRRLTGKLVNILAPPRHLLSDERTRPPMTSNRTYSMVLDDASREVEKPGHYVAS